MALQLTLSDRSGLPLYRQVQDQLAAAVLAGTLAPGASLPSVRDLAADLGVSAITVRRAYAELETAGLLVRLQGRGTFVAEDVHTRAQAWARDQALGALTEAVAAARLVGVDHPTILDTVAQVLRREGVHD